MMVKLMMKEDGIIPKVSEISPTRIKGYSDSGQRLFQLWSNIVPTRIKDFSDSD